MTVNQLIIKAIRTYFDNSRVQRYPRLFQDLTLTLKQEHTERMFSLIITQQVRSDYYWRYFISGVSTFKTTFPLKMVTSRSTPWIKTLECPEYNLRLDMPLEALDIEVRDKLIDDLVIVFEHSKLDPELIMKIRDTYAEWTTEMSETASTPRMGK